MALDLRPWHKPCHVGIPWMDYLDIYEMSNGQLVDRLWVGQIVQACSALGVPRPR
jgi:hypothetical protein